MLAAVNTRAQAIAATIQLQSEGYNTTIEGKPMTKGQGYYIWYWVKPAYRRVAWTF